MVYVPRVVDAELSELLSAVGAVVLEGPRAVGKTATARQQAASEVLLDVDLNARQLAAVDPVLLLPGAVPRLLDEWQIEPRLWNQVRREVTLGVTRDSSSSPAPPYPLMTTPVTPGPGALPG